MTTTKKYPLYKYILAAIDWLTIIAAFGVAFQLEGKWLPTEIDEPLMVGVASYVAFVAVLGVFVFHYLGMYQIHMVVTIVNHLVQLVKGLAILIVGVAVLSFALREKFVVDSRMLAWYFVVSAFVLFVIIRVGIFRSAYLFLSRNKVLQRNVLLIGARENGRKVAVNLFLHDYIGLRVVGFLDDEVNIDTPIFGGATVLGRLADMERVVTEHQVGEIVICLEHVDHTNLMQIMERTIALNAIIKIASPLYEIIPMRRSIEHYGSIPVVGVFQSGISRRKELLKRMFDVTAASILLVLQTPVLIVVGALIKLESKGPVFYKQARIGKNGKPFNLYKFRSMTVGADNDEERKKQMAAFIKSKEKYRPGSEVSTKIVNTARVTRIGKLLRKISLDEMPQLINVIRGEMSLVGPRPCLPYEWEQYEEWHKRRLTVLPGITGMWQVTGRSIVGFEDMVILDLHYIQNASLVLDLRVLMKTIPVVLFGTGGK